MNDSDFDADDETRRLLRAADPARALPSADPARVSALLEETMSQPVNEPKGPARSRLLLIAGAAAAAVVATVVAIGVTGDGDEPGNSGDPIALETLPAYGRTQEIVTVSSANLDAHAYQIVTSAAVFDYRARGPVMVRYAEFWPALRASEQQLQDFADAQGIDLLTLAIGGLAAQPAVSSVIAGVSRPEQVAANVAAASWVPDESQLAELAEIGRPARSHTTFAT